MANPRRGLFVIGTDTGVGKTAVSCALLRLSLRRGTPFVPFKPAETGCQPVPLDAEALRQAAGSPLPLAEICLYALPTPAAPAVAAAQAGVAIDLGAIAAQAQRLGDTGAPLLVEGAGGLLVPYAGALTTADLAAQLALPILVVARAALGTVNHSALTLAELGRRRLPLAGLILVETAPGQADPDLDNPRQIATLTGVAPLGTLPFVARPDPDRLADALLLALGPAAVDGLLAGVLAL